MTVALLELLIECFHSHDQHLCKFIETKESVCIRKEFNSQRTGLGHQHGRRFIVLGHQYGHRDVMWKHSIPHVVVIFSEISENVIPFATGSCRKFKPDVLVEWKAPEDNLTRYTQMWPNHPRKAKVDLLSRTFSSWTEIPVILVQLRLLHW